MSFTNQKNCVWLSTLNDTVCFFGFVYFFVVICNLTKGKFIKIFRFLSVTNCCLTLVLFSDLHLCLGKRSGKEPVRINFEFSLITKFIYLTICTQRSLTHCSFYNSTAFPFPSSIFPPSLKKKKIWKVTHTNFAYPAYKKKKISAQYLYLNFVFYDWTTLWVITP